MIKKLIVILIFFVLITPVGAIVETEKIDNSTNIDVELSYSTQDPGSKEFFVIATINSDIDSDRVVVDWDLPTYIRFSDENEIPTSSTSLRQGQSTQVKKLVRPLAKGEYEIEVNVTAVKADVNYISTDQITIEFNEEKEILPLTDEYKNAKLTYQITRIIIYSFVTLIASTGLYLLYRRIKSIQ